MAGPNLKTIRTAIKTALDAATQTRAVAYYAYLPNPNACTSYPFGFLKHAAPGIDYQMTFGPSGLTQINLELEVRATSADGVSGEQVLDDLLGCGTGSTSSIHDALNALGTIGGTVGSSSSHLASPPQPARDGNGTELWWSARFGITINTLKG